MTTPPPRRVVLICGPPGAGKTTYAHTLGLTVYDVDDDQWPNEHTFTQALRTIATDPRAQAAVIRSGATPTARTKAATLIRATETIVLATDPTTCANRVTTRNRPDHHRELAGIRTWWTKYQPDQTEHDHTATPRPRARRNTRNTTTRDHHRRTIARGEPACALCGQPIDYTLPHLNPRAYTVDHITPLALGGTDTLDNKQAAHRECNAKKAARLVSPVVRRSGTLR